MFFQKVFFKLSRTFFLSALPFTLITGLPKAAFSASLSAQNFDAIYVFGDSFSDEGNVFKYTGGSTPLSPPYFEGRFSNGPVWVEYLANKFGTTSTNFAYGGSSTGIGNAVAPEVPLPGLLTQTKLFTQANPNADANALYTVWAGANDYLFGGITDPTVPLNNLSAAVTSLYTSGARNIMVVDLADMGKFPANSVDSKISSSLNALTEAHNSGLAATLDYLSQQKPNINIIPLDVNSLFNRAIAAPTKFGFTNVTDSCLIGIVVCDNPNEYLFWDNSHPTTAAHKLIGELAFSALKSEPVTVPEPSTGLPVLVIVIGCILVRRKRCEMSNRTESYVNAETVTGVGVKIISKPT
jgi:thermolabile hemolysin